MVAGHPAPFEPRQVQIVGGGGSWSLPAKSLVLRRLYVARVIGVEDPVLGVTGVTDSMHKSEGLEDEVIVRSTAAGNLDWGISKNVRASWMCEAWIRPLMQTIHGRISTCHPASR